MAYTTVGAITASSWQVSGENVDAAVIDNAINKADAVIDGYLAGVYTVPFTSTPVLVGHLSMTLARYYGLINVSKTLGILQEPDKLAYDDAMDILNMLRKREMVLPGVSLLDADTTVWSNTMDYQPIFDVDNEMNYGVASARLEAVEDKRDGGESE
jgi:phage gp36-like protein